MVRVSGEHGFTTGTNRDSMRNGPALAIKN
jgi:hypothetical protein